MFTVFSPVTGVLCKSGQALKINFDKWPSQKVMGWARPNRSEITFRIQNFKQAYLKVIFTQQVHLSLNRPIAV